jgi:hypothetical protein
VRDRKRAVTCCAVPPRSIADRPPRCRSDEIDANIDEPLEFLAKRNILPDKRKIFEIYLHPDGARLRFALHRAFMPKPATALKERSPDEETADFNST